MLRTITELVPFGDDSRARPIAKMFLANVGRADLPNCCNYLVVYAEQASMFSDNKPILTAKFIESYNRMAPTFALMKKIYEEDGWLSPVQLRQVLDEYEKAVLDNMIEKAQQ